MKKSFKRYLAMLLSCLLLLSAAPVYGADTTSASKVRDGEYSVDFRILKNGTNSQSVAEGYLESKTGKLIAQDGKYKLQIKFINYDWFHYWGSLKADGTPAGENAAAASQYDEAKEIEVLPGMTKRGVGMPDTQVDDYYGTVEFAIEDIRVNQDVLMHIVVKDTYIYNPGTDSWLEFGYNNWYRAQIAIDVSNLPFVPLNDEPSGTGATREALSEKVEQARLLHRDSVDGNWEGAYLPGARSSLLYVIEKAEALLADGAADANDINKTYNELVQMLSYFNEQLVHIDKSALLNVLNQANSLKPTLSYVAPNDVYQAGYIVGYAISLDTVLLNSQTVYDNGQATQAEVDASRTALLNALSEIERNRIVEGNTKLIVLDSLASDAVESVHRDLFEEVVATFTNASKRTHVNVTLNTGKDDLEATALAYYRPALNGTTTFVSLKHYPTETGIDKGADKYSLQFILNPSLSAGQSVSGIIHLNYATKEEPTVTQSVYLSMNGQALDNLNKDVAYAEGLANGNQNADGDALAKLQQAIVEAKAVGQQLSSTRPSIDLASENLGKAVGEFLTTKNETRHYTIAHATDSAFSSSDSYFGKPAVFGGDGAGANSVIITILNSSQIKSFQYKQADGTYVSPQVLSEDTSGNSRTVLLKNISASGLLDAKLQVSIPAANYERTHDIRINWNGVDNAELSGEINAGNTKLRSVQAGTEPGQYPAAAITAYRAAIATASLEAVNTNGSQAATDAALNALRQAVQTFNAAVVPPATGNPDPGNPDTGTNPPVTPVGPVYPADGTYYVPFTILKKDSGETSVANQYFVSPALVKVSGGSKTVSFTVQQSAEITGLTVGGSSGSVTSSDAAKNTRVVTFTLSDLSQKLRSWVKVDWPAVNYHYSYDIDFLFNEAGAYAASGSDVIGGGPVGPPGLPNPATPGSGTTPGDDGDDEQSEGSEGANPGTNPGTPATPNVEFSDTASHWAKESIDRAVKLGIVNGYQDGNFRPENVVTRGEFAVMLSRALQLEGEGDSLAFGDIGDIPAWAQSHVARAVAAGLIGGFEDGTFRSSGKLSRAQLAVMVSRAADLKLDEADAVTFDDGGQIPAWAQKEVAAAVKAGLIQGKEGNVFDPHATATRAQALTLIMRLVDSFTQS
ncbi:NEAT domain-containing protein [Paenibacillus sp. CAU 1782]